MTSSGSQATTLGGVGTVAPMAVAEPRRMTAAEYFTLPEQRFTELIDGVIVVNEPSVRHQRIVGWLYARLLAFAEANPGLGEPGLSVDVPINDRNVFAPDVWWTLPEHTPGRDALRLAGVPDLAVEVRSPSTWRHDIGAKASHYERVGLPELWLLDTVADTVLVRRRSDADELTFDVNLEVGAGEVLTTPIVPGFELDVGELFDR